MATRLNAPRSLLALTAVALLLLLPRSSHARALTPAESGQLDAFIRAVQGCARIPALGLSLVGDGQVVYEQGYGMVNPTDSKTRQATKPDTVFCLGSSTQAFTAVLLARLLSSKENQTFETPLHKITGSRVYLPGRYRTELVNLKDVLGMRTGISNMDIVATALGANRYRFMQNLRFAPEVQTFRGDNVFSEALFPLAEEVTSRLGGGDKWYRLVRQYIFKPLGMDDISFVHVDARQNSKLAVPVVRYDDQFISVPMESFKGQEIVAAATSVCASATDMSKWIRFILSGGKNANNEQLVSEEALRSTFRSVQSRGGDDDTYSSGFTQPTIPTSYTRDSNALGWIKGQYQGYTFLSQDGSLPGYQSLTTILPSRNVGVFTAFTGDGGARAYAAKTLINIFALDLLLHGQPRINRNSVCATMDKMVEITTASEPRPSYIGRATEPIRPIEEYEGTYRNFAFGDVTVRRNESGTLRLEYGEMGHYFLYPSPLNDTFTMRAQGPLSFTTNAEYYREKGSYLAIFAGRYNDPNRRIETITIPHFARDMDPEFSKHPVVPRRHEDDLDLQCDACAALTVSFGMLVTSVFMSVLGLSR